MIKDNQALKPKNKSSVQKFFIYTLVIVITITFAGYLWHIWESSSVMKEDPHPFCDLDRDFDCDDNDLKLIHNNLGKCVGQPDYYDYDLDGNGCVTLQDEQIFIDLKKSYESRDSNQAR